MTDPLLERLQDALNGRYAIVRELGRGSMAVVYLARDLRHERDVAIKVLQPEITTPDTVERFLREIRILAGLRHPNILSIYDFGLEDGLCYYVTAYLDGSSLRDRLLREKTLSVDGAVRVGIEVLSALTYAHSRGVVHTNIKPDNIFFREGRAVVADFRIARALNEDGDSITATGMAAGSPHYLSPEQAHGAERIDARSDLYSVGCVIFEMVAGRPPFDGDSVLDVVLKHVHAAPPQVRDFRPDAPVALEGILAHALEKDPTDRYQSAEAMTQALEGGEPEPTMDVRATLRVQARDTVERVAPAMAAEPRVAASRKGIRSAPKPGPEPVQWRRVTLLYGTDRAPSGRAEPNRFYGTGRGKLQLGEATVTIPTVHRITRLERPCWYRAEIKENPARHIVLIAVRPLDTATWLGAVGSGLSRSPERDALVFIHGYNVDFAEAARRAAQLTCDLRFEGVPLLYSWPSRGSVLGYLADRGTVAYSIAHLTEFLRLILSKSEATRVHLIAHSLGAEVMTGALRALASAGLPTSFHQVVLAAPDIDAQVFTEQILPAIRPTLARLTLYASSNDHALKWSRRLHWYRRAGEGGKNLLLADGVDTVDASPVPGDLLGHSLFATAAPLLNDLHYLINEELPPGRRYLQERTRGKGAYWEFYDER